MARFLFGEGKKLVCQTRTVNPGIAGEDVATVLLEMKYGITVTCNLSFASCTEIERFPETFILVEAARGSVKLAPDFSIRVTDAEGTFSKRCPPPIYRWADPDYALVHASIVECHRNLRNGLRGIEAAETTGVDNLRTLELVFGAYESARRGEVVEMPFCKRESSNVNNKSIKVANGPGNQSPVTQVLALRCLRSGAGASCDFHSHPFPEFTLVTDDSTVNGWALGKIGSAPNTLYLFLPGEPHGHWNSSTQRPRFWVIHFSAALLDSMPHLANPDPAQRVWKLSDEQATTFRWLFIKLFNEHTHSHAFNQVAEISWLQLLLVSVERWVTGTGYQELLPEQPDSDVLQLGTWSTNVSADLRNS